MTGPTAVGDDSSTVLAGELAALLIGDHQLRTRRRPVIAIAGESGSGKSVTASALARCLSASGIPAAVLHQDDYFVRPPRANHEHRMRDLSSVGPQEVNAALLQSHVEHFRGARDGVVVPRVHYPTDCFLTASVDFGPVAVLVVEGTYALRLVTADVGIFLEATHDDTHERRRIRNRDIDAPIIGQVLAIEHTIIGQQRELARIVIDRAFSIRPSQR